MSEGILSVGIDLGTTTTQMIVSRLQVENTASAFAVPRMEIRKREILYRGGIHFTPLLSADTIDAAAVAEIIEEEYQAAGITPQQVQTGAVIITGETARKENAREVLSALSKLAGDFVVATAGPALESVLAARGAGADQAAKERGRYVLHFDIGGGTSNLALFDPEGRLIDTGCLNVGGRLLKFDEHGAVTYVSPVLRDMDHSHPERLARMLASVLEEAAGLTPVRLLPDFITDKTVQLPQSPVLLSFSGGVADLIGAEKPPYAYGDLGVLLGQAIFQSKLCQGEYLLGQETIRATVIGAGSHATELSGSTICHANMTFPVQNLPVTKWGEAPMGETAWFLEGKQSPSFREIEELADSIAEKAQKPLVVAVERDMAKALGQALRLRLGMDYPLICLDGIHIPEGSYLDIAAPIAGGTAVPVVVKTLAFL